MCICVGLKNRIWYKASRGVRLGKYILYTIPKIEVFIHHVIELPVKENGDMPSSYYTNHFPSNLRFCWSLSIQPRKHRRSPPTPKKVQHLLAHPQLSRLRKSSLQVSEFVSLDEYSCAIGRHALIKQPAHRQSNRFWLIERHSVTSHSFCMLLRRLTLLAVTRAKNRGDGYGGGNNGDGDVDFGTFLLEGTHETDDACIGELASPSSSI